MNYELYRGYILGPGMQWPDAGIFQVNVYRNIQEAKNLNPFFYEDNEFEAKMKIDREVDLYSSIGIATQADVDELNQGSDLQKGEYIKQGTIVKIFDEYGNELASFQIGGCRIYDNEAVGEALFRALPNSVFTNVFGG